MVPTLDSCEGKLRRAKEHFALLRHVIAGLEKAGPHTFLVEHDPQGSCYVIKVLGLKESRPEWGYLLGDCLHNARSALDHLVFQLAILGKGNKPLTDDEARQPAFPVITAPKRYADATREKLKLLREGDRARIKELQPFNSLDPSIWGWMPHSQPSLPVIPDALRLLDHFENVDKHRLVIPTWRTVKRYDGQAPELPKGIIRTEVVRDALEDGAEVARWFYEPGLAPELPPDMDMERHYPIGVALEDPPYFRDAVEILEDLIHAVGYVIEIFRPCMQGSAPRPVSEFLFRGYFRRSLDV